MLVAVIVLEWFAQGTLVEQILVDETVEEQKFFREAYVNWHVYAQYFHPTTLLERVRNVNAYRKHNVLFKGFSMPDWA